MADYFEAPVGDEQESTCSCRCGCEVPLNGGTCVDCGEGTHQNNNRIKGVRTMGYRYTKLDVQRALIGLCRAAGVPVAGGVGSYQLRAVDSTGSLGLFEEIGAAGGVRRLVAGYTAKTKREACMMIAAYREGIEAARA